MTPWLSSILPSPMAVVYDWMDVRHGGAEQVLMAFHQLFPQASFFTSIYHPQIANWANHWTIHSSWMRVIPDPIKNHRWLSPLMPLAFEELNLSEYQMVISVSSAFAKGILTKPDQLHVNYLLTPPRFLYTHVNSYC